MVSARWAIGRVGQPRGLKGHVRVRLSRNEPLYLEPGRVLLGAEEAEPRAIRVLEQQGPSVVLQIQGIDTREGAESIHGQDLWVDPAWYSVRLPAEALVGAQVVDADRGDPLGEVSDFYDNGAQVVLELARGESRHLVPYVENFFVEVTPGRPPVLRLRPIPGLLDEAE